MQYSHHILFSCNDASSLSLKFYIIFLSYLISMNVSLTNGFQLQGYLSYIEAWILILYEPRYEKTCFLHMPKQSGRLAAQ